MNNAPLRSYTAPTPWANIKHSAAKPGNPNRIVPLVTAGRANGELLSTIAGLVAQAGLEMPFALLEGADRSDQTLGQPAPMAEDHDELAAAQSR